MIRVAGIALPLVFIAFVLVGCEHPGVPHPLAASVAMGDGPETGAPGPSPSPAATAEPMATPEPAVTAGPTVTADPTATAEPARIDSIAISLKDFVLDPDELTVSAGTVTFVLKNEGRYTHDFRVEGQGVDKKAPKVGRGRTFEWQVTLPPGEYRISCPVSNHADRGMAGTLTVIE